jgi:hypothetical protein
LIGKESVNGMGLAKSSSSFWATSRLFSVRSDSKTVVAQTTAVMPVDRTLAAQQPQRISRLAPQSTGLFVPLSRKSAQP